MGTLAKGPVFLFVLVIITNFLINLFSCDFRNLFKINIYMKWIVGYFVMYFVVFLGNYEGHKPILTLALYSLGYFVWFIALSKLEPVFFFIILSILAIGFMTDLYIEHHSQHPDEKHLNKYKDAHTLAIYIALVLTIVGFIYNFYENHYIVPENKKDIYSFLFNTQCSDT